jgi:hypothetical protein
MITVIMRRAGALVGVTAEGEYPAPVVVPALAYALGGEVTWGTLEFAATVRALADDFAKTRLTGPQPVK